MQGQFIYNKILIQFVYDNKIYALLGPVGFECLNQPNAPLISCMQWPFVYNEIIKMMPFWPVGFKCANQNNAPLISCVCKDNLFMIR